MPTIDQVHLNMLIALSDSDLASLPADADAAARTRDIQVCVTGRFVSSRYGKFEITESDMDTMIANFTRNYPIPPTELAGDYDHLSLDPKQVGDGKASCWFKRLFKKPSAARDENGQPKVELWATVEWTPPAAKAIANKEYRFWSPTFVKNYITNTGKKIGATVLGGALTNRPFLQGMAAITLSLTGEVAGPAPSERNHNMSKITLKDAQGNDVEVNLSDITANAAVRAAIAPPQQQQQTASPDVTALNTTVAALSTVVTNLAESFKQDRTERQNEKAESAVVALMREGKIAPKDKDTWVNLAKSNYSTFIALSATLQPVKELRKNHGQSGSESVQSTGNHADADATDDAPEPGEEAIKMFDDAVAAAQTANPKLTADAAIAQVAKQRPDLAKAYTLSYRVQ